jgi:hypothetical protein
VGNACQGQTREGTSFRRAALVGFLLFIAAPSAAGAGSDPVELPRMRPAAGPAVKLPKPGVVRNAIVPFAVSAFPYAGMIPDEDKPFLDAVDGDRRGHTAPRGGIHWENETYDSRQVLLYVPKTFDLRRPAAIVVFFHGNNVILARDVRDRQRVPAQLAASGLNAVLVAPQFALDAPDSSAGHFWEPGTFKAFLHEAAGRLATLSGAPAAAGLFDQLPVVIVAYSGGYLAAAYSLAVGGADERIHGLILLDALYGQEDKFYDWILRRGKSAFVFSAYSDSARAGNEEVEHRLALQHAEPTTTAPAKLKQGVVAFLYAGPDIVHDDFVTEAWRKDPLKWVLSRVVLDSKKAAGAARR